MRKQRLRSAMRSMSAWTGANKSAALASYAAQVKDPTLGNYAKRIRARAIRRSGLLLDEVLSRNAVKTENQTVCAYSLIAPRWREIPGYLNTSKTKRFG